MSEHQESLQESEYSFPYHYLPTLAGETPSIRRFLGWGWEYMTYIQFLLEEIKRLNPSSVLDIGCGDGAMINQLCSGGFSGQVKGVDTSQRAITFAKAFCPKGLDGVFEVADIFKMSGTAELVSMVEVIEHIPDGIVDDFIKKAFSLSSRYVLISVPTTAFPLQKKHYRHYDEDILSRQTSFSQSEFELVYTQRLYDETKTLKLIKRVLENKFFAVNWKPLLSCLWKYHQRKTFFSEAPKGFHLVALYRRK